jgi:uncharacterized membrane protein
MQSGSLKTEVAGSFKTFATCLTDYTVTSQKIVILIQLGSFICVLHIIFKSHRQTDRVEIRLVAYKPVLTYINIYIYSKI